MRYVKLSREQAEKLLHQVTHVAPPKPSSAPELEKPTPPPGATPRPNFTRSTDTHRPRPGACASSPRFWPTAAEAVAHVTDWTREVDLKWTRKGWTLKVGS